MLIKSKKIITELNSRNNLIRREVEIADIFFLLAIIGIYALMLMNSHRLMDEVESNIYLYGWIGLFVASFILELVPQLFDPGYGVFVAMAAGISILNSTIIIILGSLLGGYISYELGRKFGPKFIFPIFNPKIIDKTVLFFNRYGKYILLLGALTPFPYFPIIFGALMLPRKQFVIYGLIPRIISFILFGLAIHYGVSWYNQF